MAGLGLVALVACAKTKHKAPPPPPPTLTIAAIRGVGAAALASDCGGSCCVEVGTDPSATVVVTVTQSEPSFLLRPPGMCGQNTQCGYLGLEVDPSEAGPLRTDRSATSDVPLRVGDLTGPHHVYVELRYENDLPVGDATGQPVHAELDVVLSPPGGCSATPDAAADSVTDAAEDSVTDAAEDSVTDAAEDSVTDAAKDSVTDAAEDSVTDAAEDSMADAGATSEDAAEDSMVDAGATSEDAAEE